MGETIAQIIDRHGCGGDGVSAVHARSVDEFPTGNMLWDTASYIAEISKTITFHPGDVIWLGTDGWPRNMVPGDVCEIEISGIGILRNPIRAELPPPPSS